MSTTWTPMDYGRLVAGSFVPAELVLDIAGRDYGAMDCVVDWSLDQVTTSDNDDIWTDWFDVYIGFPESWAVDPAWGLTLRISLQIYFTVVSGGGLGASYKYRLTTAGTQVTGNGWKTLTVDIPLTGSTPTGLTAYKVQAAINSDTGALVGAERAPGARSPDSWRLVSL